MKTLFDFFIFCEFLGYVGENMQQPPMPFQQKYSYIRQGHCVCECVWVCVYAQNRMIEVTVFSR